MRCLTDAKYTMKADVYDQVTTRTPSGQVQRRWVFLKTIDVFARGVMEGGIRVAGSTERWGEDYEDVEYVFMKAREPLSKRMRIANIRDKRTGRAIWTKPVVEWNSTEQSFTITGYEDIEYEVYGVTPVVDPFGRTTEYTHMLAGVTND